MKTTIHMFTLLLAVKPSHSYGNHQTPHATKYSSWHSWIFYMTQKPTSPNPHKWEGFFFVRQAKGNHWVDPVLLVISLHSFVGSFKMLTESCPAISIAKFLIAPQPIPLSGMMLFSCHQCLLDLIWHNALIHPPLFLECTKKHTVEKMRNFKRIFWHWTHLWNLREH